MARIAAWLVVGSLLALASCSEDGAQGVTDDAGGSVSDATVENAGGGSSGELPEHWKEGLQSGINWGLAADFPDDVGIGSNPFVLGSEDFETGTVTIVTEEDRYKNNVQVTDTEHYTGKYAGVHSWPQGLNGVTTRFPLTAQAHQDARPAYFERMCFKYDKSFHPGESMAGVGVKGFGIYFENGSGNADTCAGMSWYDVSCQFVGWGPSQKPQANDGYLWVGHMYSYNRYPEQAIATLGTIKLTDPPDGTQSCRFSSYADPFEYIVLQTWRCYELGLYLNTPGQNDGEARFWIDGVLQSRTTNMRFRDLEEQKPSSMHLNLYRTTEDFPQTMVRWADNIVLARRYIGPVKVSR
ncbi:MAG: hypothetical protein HY898_04235 [Deltaproteobacteria bacterium]|nr:hypothetical protein [Deltaproteobacteria bacterium]